MEDSELKAIREARLRELKSEAPRSREDEARSAMLPQLLSQDARERLNRIRIVRPERATQVEELVVKMGQTGQLSHRLSEKELVGLLDQISGHETNSRIKISRKDSNDDFDEPDLKTTEKTGDDFSDDDFFD